MYLLIAFLFFLLFTTFFVVYVFFLFIYFLPVVLVFALFLFVLMTNMSFSACSHERYAAKSVGYVSRKCSQTRKKQGSARTNSRCRLFELWRSLRRYGSSQPLHLQRHCPRSPLISEGKRERVKKEFIYLFMVLIGFVQFFYPFASLFWMTTESTHFRDRPLHPAWGCRTPERIESLNAVAVAAAKEERVDVIDLWKVTEGRYAINVCLFVCFFLYFLIYSCFFLVSLLIVSFSLLLFDPFQSYFLSLLFFFFFLSFPLFSLDTVIFLGSFICSFIS